MARLPAFTRKGAGPAKGGGVAQTIAKEPPTGQDAGDSEGPGDETSGPEEAGPDEQADPSEIAVCPNCGCTFDDQTGKVIPEGHPQHPGTGLPSAGGGAGGQDESGQGSAGDEN